MRVHTWDEQDRLIEVRDLQTDELLLQNRYDGLSRRRERVQLEDGMLVTNRYVYDGWLVVAVLDGENEVLEQYVHGMDLSGSRDGAYSPRYQFSSKEYDATVGLNYYGYRFYHPELGR